MVWKVAEGIRGRCDSDPQIRLGGWQHLTDKGLAAMAECSHLRILNLTWYTPAARLGLRLGSGLRESARWQVWACDRRGSQGSGPQHPPAGESEVWAQGWEGRGSGVWALTWGWGDGGMGGSLYGNLGVTDEGLQALSRGCAETLGTLYVNGCTGIKVGGEGGEGVV